MKTAILIPARYASSRYPGKPLVELRGAGGCPKPLIQRSYEAGLRVPDVTSVHVVTDDERIAEAARLCGAPVLMTSESCRNGTERCAEALDQLDDPDIVVNLQGDALLTPPTYIEAAVKRLADDAGAGVATPCFRLRSGELRKLQEEEMAGRIGGTSVVVDGEGRAMYFSKRLIPYVTPESIGGEWSPVRFHVGVYAYRPDALRRYVAEQVSELETLEGLEQLRFLVAGVPVAAVEVEAPRFALRELNNPEDVEPIEQALKEAGLE